MNILDLFHHIHHDTHVVHHCGGKHVEMNPKLDYNIGHCSCGKHRIDKQQAVGHDFDINEIKVIFDELCPQGGWHVESGKIY